MFDSRTNSSIFEHWAELWRQHRGQSQWPLVDATVVMREVIPADEGPEVYRLTVKYLALGLSGKTIEYAGTFNITAGTNLASLSAGDTTRIRYHPALPWQIIPQDLSQLTYDLRTILIFVAVIVLILGYFALGGTIDWGGSD